MNNIYAVEYFLIIQKTVLDNIFFFNLAMIVVVDLNYTPISVYYYEHTAFKTLFALHPLLLFIF